ncbi:hypothetical protein HUG12_01365 [Halorarum salinum]|uniref:Uncharacterized protein n=2 Tax=Halorarum salinum TaxID=2743089 RepID=A0A7D5QJT7_9EURY|nr:hypothetical protein HUG12_01365 [Halobaculum salinum]
MKDLETGETLSECPKVDISPAVERAAIRNETIEGELPENDRRTTERNILADEFVPAFGAVNLLNHVESNFSD